MEKKFWLVWNPNDPIPRYMVKHFNKLEADMEAERLARNSPGNIYYVLESLSFVQMGDLIREDTLDLCFVCAPPPGQNSPQITGKNPG